MKKHLLVVIGLASTLLCAGAAHAGCTKDTDCKGDRICHQGLCTNPSAAAAPALAPAAAPAPAPAPRPLSPPVSEVDPEQPPPGVDGSVAARPASVTPAAPLAAAAPGVAPGVAATAVTAPQAAGPLTWHTGYAEIGTPINISGWAGFSNSDEGITSGFGAGVRVAGYHAGRSVHVGGFLAYAATDYSVDGYSGSAEASNLSAGAALKFGGAVGSRVWMGFALDVGVNVLFKGDAFTRNLGGLSIYTGYVLDVLAVGSGPFKMAITSRLGSQIEPYMSNSEIDNFMWQARLGLTIGVTFGGRSG